MPITALPTPPTRSDPLNFSTRADAFLSAIPTFATEANALQVDVNNKQATASAAATSASDSQTAAAASKTAAEAASNATAWVSGTTYAVGNVRYSPTDFMSYRRKTAGAGTTDPVSDTTNWTLLTGNVNLGSTQTLSNKTLDNSCSIGGIGATSLANTNTAQTLSNKTLDNSCSIGGIGATSLANTNTAQTLSNKTLDNSCSIGGIGATQLVNTGANQTITGVKTFTGTVNLSNAGFRFSSDGSQDTGIFWIGDGRIGFLANGAGVGEVNTAGLDMPLSLSRVQSANAALGTGQVGTYAFLRPTSSAIYEPGSTSAGSNLRYSSTSPTIDLLGSSETGTWRCMGRTTNEYTTLWLRIS